MNPVAGLVYWPKEQGVTDKTTGPMVYFRAENRNYTMDGNVPPIAAAIPTVPVAVASNVKSESLQVWPAVDTTLSNFQGMDNYVPGRGTAYTWVNPQSFQLFTSGLDQKYATPHITAPAVPLDANVDCTTFPTGESYQRDSFDDITNFSKGGTLESARPQ